MLWLVLLSPSSAQYTVSYTSDGFSVYSGGKVVYATTETPDYVDFTYHNEPFDMWYVIGHCIGDGNWNNSPEYVGTSMFPMKPDNGIMITQDPDGAFMSKGILRFSCYPLADATLGIKLIRKPGDWTEQWGISDDGSLVKDCLSGSIVVSESGFYTIELNTADDVLYIYRIGDTQTTYESICVRGSWDGWTADKPMTLCPMNGFESHIWKTEIESDGTISFKFKTPGGWDANWGGSIDDVFPYGNARNDGYDIRVPAGKWIVLFNDIDLSYAQVSK